MTTPRKHIKVLMRRLHYLRKTKQERSYAVGEINAIVFAIDAIASQHKIDVDIIDDKSTQDRRRHHRRHRSTKTRKTHWRPK